MIGKKYEDYKKALEFLNMKTLVQRRQVLGLNFAKSCLKNDKVKNFFPLNNRHNKNVRNQEEFKWILPEHKDTQVLQYNSKYAKTSKQRWLAEKKYA